QLKTRFGGCEVFLVSASLFFDLQALAEQVDLGGDAEHHVQRDGIDRSKLGAEKLYNARGLTGDFERETEHGGKPCLGRRVRADVSRFGGQVRDPDGLIAQENAARPSVPGCEQARVGGFKCVEPLWRSAPGRAAPQGASF